MDLNHDKQIQSLLCYRYTIGQGASGKLKNFRVQSSWCWGLAQTNWLAVFIAFSIFFAVPTHADETNAILKQVELNLRTALSNVQQAPAFEYPESGELQTTYLPQKFFVHNIWMTGEIATNAHEEIGPSYKGFILSVYLQSIGDLNQKTTPQTWSEPYWQTDVDVAAVNGTTNQIFWALSYGSRTDKELLQTIRNVLKSMAGREAVSKPPKN